VGVAVGVAVDAPTAVAIFDDAVPADSEPAPERLAVLASSASSASSTASSAAATAASASSTAAFRSVVSMRASSSPASTASPTSTSTDVTVPAAGKDTWAESTVATSPVPARVWVIGPVLATAVT